MRLISLRSFLTILLVILIMMIFSLAYLYYVISRPPGPPAFQIRQMKHVLSIYGYGAKSEEMLLRPTDVAFDSDGNIYVADTGHARVVVFSSSGKYLKTIGKRGSGSGELLEPIGITVSLDGWVYVADKNMNKIVIYNKDGLVHSEFAASIPLKPLAANGNLYLTTHDRIIIYTLKGRKVLEWGRGGREVGSVGSPTGIAVARDGKVFVSDTLNLRLQAFSPNGNVLWVRGEPPSDIVAPGREFGLPSGIAVDERNRLYLVDAFHNVIRVLDPDGTDIAKLSRRGKRDGELYLPSGIAYGRNGIFAIADKFNDRVQIVKITLD